MVKQKYASKILIIIQYVVVIYNVREIPHNSKCCVALENSKKANYLKSFCFHLAIQIIFVYNVSYTILFAKQRVYSPKYEMCL